MRLTDILFSLLTSKEEKRMIKETHDIILVGEINYLKRLNERLIEIASNRPLLSINFGQEYDAQKEIEKEMQQRISYYIDMYTHLTKYP